MIKGAVSVAIVWACLFTSPVFAADQGPPLEPVGEQSVSHPDSEGMSKCIAALKFILPSAQSLYTFVVSFNRAWGQVLRADISSDDMPPVRTRFVCPLQSGTRPAPIVIAVEPKVPLLTSGSWGEVRSGNK